MSRLDSAIRRLEAQRACLGAAAALVAEVPGCALELGLGNGRTYDHLRGLLPGREIFVFERTVRAHPDCVPDAGHLMVGDMTQTLPAAAGRLPAAALAHADIGSGDVAASRAMGRWLAGALPALLAAGAVVLGDQEMPAPGWTPLSLPRGVAAGRYFMYRAGGS